MEEIFNVDDEIIVINKENYKQQILDILRNYQNYVHIRNNLHKKCISNFTYESWAKYISDRLP